MDTNNDRRRFLRGAMTATGVAATSMPRFTLAKSKSSEISIPPTGIAKLNANENPIGPSPKAKKAIAEAANYSAYYVGENVKRLKSMIADYNGVTTKNVALSSGSSGVLTYLAVGASRNGKILGPDLFWDTTVKAAIRQGAKLTRLDKSPDLSINLTDMAASIDTDTALVHITNPNNPTGLLLDAAALRSFCRKISGETIVLVDEAYNELTDNPENNTMIDLIREGYNVAVARTFSKIYGLAGLRVGYMIGSEATIAMVNQYGLGDYALNQAGVAAALASYTDEMFMADSKARIIEAKETVVAALKTNGLSSLPSQTNFLFVNLGSLNAEKFRHEMEARGVLIRGIYRDYTNWSRVSMGAAKDVEQYINNVPRVLEALKA